ncbi:MAG: YlxR family protein [Dermatophilaceae bacterium]|nr:YlxR family protein [Actinomycetales bacterium]MBP8881415.1 YlxR family protein [Dermatophilaceae bacterium]MBP9917707.1 YlxR family protein [Dermatophilaceae bacterium]
MRSRQAWGKSGGLEGRLTGTDRSGLRATSLDSTTARSDPRRTCVGCRRVDSRSALVRVVSDVDAEGGLALIVDTRRRLPGRGLWLHPDPDCLASAVRRRAFGRALRLSGQPDLADVTAYVEAQQGGTQHPYRHHQHHHQGGLDADEHPMSTQQ